LVKDRENKVQKVESLFKRAKSSKKDQKGLKDPNGPMGHNRPKWTKMDQKVQKRKHKQSFGLFDGDSIYCNDAMMMLFDLQTLV
jgi:hypothetical protein